MNAPLRTGVYDFAIANVSGLSAANLWYGRALDEQVSPFCVFQAITGTHNYDSHQEVETVPVQFSFVGRNMATLTSLVEAFETQFNFNAEGSIVVAGWNLERVDKDLDLAATIFGDTWRWILQYEFMIAKLRP